MIRITYVAVATCFLIGCSQGPEPPKPGSPAFLWNSARDNYSKGDFAKTQEQLGKLTNSENEYAAKAGPWNLVLLSGMAKGYMELANTFESGAKQNKSNPTPFHRSMSDYRSLASRHATQFAEDYGKFAKGPKDAEVPLNFVSPGGTAARHALLDKVVKGVPAPAGQMEIAQREVVRTAVLMAACDAAGSANDAARLGEMLKGETAKVSREVFQRAMAQSLYDLSDLFGAKKLGKPDHRRFFLTQSLEALKSVPEDKASKDLKKKVEGGLKELKGS